MLALADGMPSAVTSSTTKFVFPSLYSTYWRRGGCEVLGVLPPWIIPSPLQHPPGCWRGSVLSAKWDGRYLLLWHQHSTVYIKILLGLYNYIILLYVICFSRNLRLDSLSQLLCHSNVQPGGKFAVFESGTQGLVTAAMLHRMGTTGHLVQIYQGTQPQR